jgi:ER lumen protein retaining receptor
LIAAAAGLTGIDIGVSLITQTLYCVVFAVRYLDLFWTHPFYDFLAFWNFTLKIFYITTSLYIVFLMTHMYARTREREKAWKMGGWSLLGSVMCAPLVAAIFMGKRPFSSRHFFEVGLFPFLFFFFFFFYSSSPSTLLLMI